MSALPIEWSARIKRVSSCCHMMQDAVADWMGAAEDAAATARTLFKSELGTLRCWALE